jgi:uncharacterized iron-regulated membrane protein
LISSKLIFRKAHRWLGLLVGLQILFWVASGLYFAVVPFDQVTGDHNKAEPSATNFAFTPLVSPQQPIAELVTVYGPSIQVRSASLRQLLGRNVYEIQFDLGGDSRVRLADAETGSLLPAVTEAQALAIARAGFLPTDEVRGIAYLEEVEPGHEYRRGALPVWQVSFDDAENTRIYVAAETGILVTHRNDTWRIFDFFWMLHIMDFDARDDFHTPLLQWASVLSLIIIVSGFVLWAMTTSLFRRRP